MALALFDRVQETTTTTGTGSITLAGAVPGFQSFAVVGNGNTCYYTIVDNSAWEVGVGTYSTSGPTLARTTILSNSNGNTTAITLAAGTKSVFLTYPASKSVNLNESGNVSALGTVSSGTWQGSTVGVAYGGTGVTTSTGANSVVLRDANGNITVNRLNQELQTITASGGTTVLTAASDFNQQLVGTGGHTFRLPDATTLTDTTAFQFNNNATGTLTIQNNASAVIGTVAPGGAAGIALMSNATVAGTWDVHGYIPENITWGTNALALGSTVITGGTWNGGTITSAYGGTGLTTFTAANNALYSTSAGALAAGTLPVLAGGTGATTAAGAQSSLNVPSTTGSGASGTWGISITGSASGSSGSVVNAATFNSGGAGDASGTTFNGSAARTISYNTIGAPSTTGTNASGTWGISITGSASGSAGSVVNAATFNNGGAGDASGTTFNGSAARTISYNTIGAPSTTGTNASGTWGINITGNASSSSYATYVYSQDIRTLSPSSTSAYRLGFGFTSWANNNTAPYADYLALRSYSDASGGNDNLVTFNKSTIAMRVWQQSFGSASAYSSYADVLMSNNYNSYAPTLTGGGASGTWGINITGNASGSSTSVSATTALGIRNSFSTSINTTTPGTTNYGISFDGHGTSDNAAGITWAWSGTNAQAGIYVQSSGAYGTKMYFGTTDSFATGSKTSMSIDHGGVVQIPRNYLQSDSSLRAPIFYDSNNTAYYLDPASTSELNKVYYNSNMVSRNYGIGQIGLYSSTRFQAVFSMGESYILPADGTSAGNLYGIAWSYPSAGGVAANLNTHGALFLENGGFLAAISGSIRCRDDMRAPIFYDSNDTGYYVDPNSISVMQTGRFRKDQTAGSYTTAALWTESFGNTATGIAFHISGVVGRFLEMRTNGLLYWEGTMVAQDDFRAPIFYDSNNTGFYVDPASTSNINTLAGNGKTALETADSYLRINQSSSFSSGIWFGSSNRLSSSGYGAWGSNGGTTTSRVWINSGSYNGSNVISLDGSNGIITAAGDVRAPIFYDSNNTGYYVDPASTSRMGTINADVLYSYGNVTAYSDERLKKDWEILPADFVEKLANVKSGTYTRIDSGERQVGVGAQSLQAVLKEAVSDSQEYLGVNYGNAALVSAVELAKYVTALEQRISQLEARL